jgi:hypothetical protein
MNIFGILHLSRAFILGYPGVQAQLKTAIRNLGMGGTNNSGVVSTGIFFRINVH